MYQAVFHIVALGGVWLAGSVGVAAEKYTLAAPVQLNEQWRVAMEMQLRGTLRVRNGEQDVNLTLAAQAKHNLTERVMRVNVEGQPTGLARFYETAEAKIDMQGVVSQRRLRPERRLVMAYQHGDHTVTYAPSGPLAREELELVGEHFNLLAAHGVLPAQPVAVGETWEISLPAAQGLTHLDGITEKKLVGKLESVNGDTAAISVTGTVEGIIRGSEAKVTVECQLRYSIAGKRLTAATWKHHTERGPGPATPGVTMDSTTTVSWSPGTSDELADEKVAALAPNPGPEQLLLYYRDPKGRFAFNHGRHWQVAAQNEKIAVLRWLELGELKAQLNIYPWTPQVPGQRITPAEVQRFVNSIPGLKADKVLFDGPAPAAQGLWVYRYTVQGSVHDVPILQCCYAVAGPNNEQVLFMFTIETEYAKDLDGMDQGIVNTIRFGG